MKRIFSVSLFLILIFPVYGIQPESPRLTDFEIVSEVDYSSSIIIKGYVTGITQCTFGLTDGCASGSRAVLLDRNEYPIVLGETYLVEAGGFTGCGRQVLSIEPASCL